MSTSQWEQLLPGKDHNLEQTAGGQEQVILLTVGETDALVLKRGFGYNLYCIYLFIYPPIHISTIYPPFHSLYTYSLSTMCWLLSLGMHERTELPSWRLHSSEGTDAQFQAVIKPRKKHKAR